jgi:hypothetical protein
MPRYFFHVQTKQGPVVPDRIGIEFRDFAAAAADRAPVKALVSRKDAGPNDVMRVLLNKWGTLAAASTFSLHGRKSGDIPSDGRGMSAQGCSGQKRRG